MELRRIFPFALNVTDLKSLLISVAIHLIIGVVGGVLVKIISIVPLIGKPARGRKIPAIRG